MRRKSREEIRQEILEEQRIQAEMDEKAEKWNYNKEIYEAWQNLAKYAGLSVFDWRTGELMIYEGTMEALSRVLQFYAGVKIDTNTTQQTTPNPQKPPLDARESR